MTGGQIYLSCYSNIATMLNLHQNKSLMKGKEIQQTDCSSIQAIDETGDAQTHVTIDFSLF